MFLSLGAHRQHLLIQGRKDKNPCNQSAYIHNLLFSAGATYWVPMKLFFPEKEFGTIYELELSWTFTNSLT